MSQLEKIKLFDIPIYSCSKQAFEKEYKKFIDNKYKDYKQHYFYSGLTSIEELNNRINNMSNRDYWKEKIWQYNQIVGYINVCIAESSIWFDLYTDNDNKKIYKFSKIKKFISLHNLSGEHFSIVESNKDIALMIEEKLYQIQNNYISKFYLDLEIFKNIYLNIDYLSVLSSKAK